MKTLLALLLLATVLLPPSGAQESAPDGGAALAARAGAVDSKQMEKDLQRLPWPKFRAIVEAVPKLRAGVEAYGAAGWQIVQANYTRYHWQKNIDKLDAEQQQQLAELIRAAKAAR